MITNLFLFAFSLYIVIKGSTMATVYAGRLAESFRLPKYTVGFIIIAIISILPETFIALNAGFAGIPSFGLGMLFGSNIADLTLIFAILTFYAGRGLKVESRILKNHITYPFVLLIPLVLGFNGHYSRLEGLALIIAGAVFYYMALRDGSESEPSVHHGHTKQRSVVMLLFSMAILLVGAHFTVVSASGIATLLGVSPILIGMLIVGLGTTMPELFFSLNSIMKKDDSLAIGDLLGTVLADATVVVGLLALVKPFFFPQRIIYVTGAFMLVSAFMLFHFMRTGRTISKREGTLLFCFWLIFVLMEFVANS